MLTQKQVNEITMLSKALATRRVKYYAVRTGNTADEDTTIASAQKAVKKAERDLESYLKQFVTVEPDAPREPQFNVTENASVEAGALVI